MIRALSSLYLWPMASQNDAMRELLFLSHANPEDNEFTLWLGLQLGREGYQVWSDLTELLGGEDFWKDIDDAIRNRAVKFIFVLTKASNTKPGPADELYLAKQIARTSGLKDFIIPVTIDDLPHSDTKIEIGRLNAIPFKESWAQGLSQLLSKLDRDGVPTNAAAGPGVVSAWWREKRQQVPVTETEEDYLSNWFSVESMPLHIYVHELASAALSADAPIPGSCSVPTFREGQHIITFANRQELTTAWGHAHFGRTRRFLSQAFLRGDGPWPQRRRRDASRIMSRLFQLAWLQFTAAKGLAHYVLANETMMSYFPLSVAGSDDRVYFKGVDSKRAYRSVVGFKTVGMDRRRRYWHFGVQARINCDEQCAVVIKPHVVFSDDGQRIWSSKERLHSARRSQCKNWWNSEWRDRICGTMSWLAAEGSAFSVPMSPGSAISVSSRSLMFRSPVSYVDPTKVIEDPLDFDDDQADDLLSSTG
jgi:hypothetical protein